MALICIGVDQFLVHYTHLRCSDPLAENLAVLRHGDFRKTCGNQSVERTMALLCSADPSPLCSSVMQNARVRSQVDFVETRRHRSIYQARTYPPPPEVMTLVAESEIPVGYCVTFIKSIFSRILRTLFFIFNRKMFFFKRALRYN